MRARLKNTFGNVGCLLGLLLLAVLVHFPLVFQGRVPLDTKPSLFLPPWEDARPPGMEAGACADPGHYQRYYPWYQVLGEAARSSDGSILWNSYEGCGMPFLALWETRALSPFSLPFYYLPQGIALPLSIVLKTIVAGWCALYAARRFGFPTPFAVFISVAYMTGGPFLLMSASPLADVLPWMPVLLLYMERLVLGQYRYWPSGAFFLTLMALGGPPSCWVVAVVFLLLYLMIRVAVQRERGARTVPALSFFLLSVGLSFSASAIQWLPWMEFLGQSNYGQAAQEGSWGLRAGDLIALFLPWFRTATGSVEYTHITSRLLHFGLPQMVLLALWFALRQYVPKLARHRFEAAGAAGLTIVMIPLLGTLWLADLFPVNQIGVAPFLALMTLPVALIAATGAEEWLRLNPDQTHATIRRFVISCTVLAAFFVILLVAQILSGVPEQNLNIALQVVLAALFGIATLAILAVTIVRTSIPFMGYGLTVLTLIGTLAAMYPAAPLSKSALSFPNTSFVNDLKETGVRVSGSSTLENWPLEANLVSQVYTPSGIQLSRYAAFRKRIGEDPMLVRRTGSTSLLLTREDIQGAFAEVRPLLRIKRVFSSGAVLFDDLEARPRAWFTYEGRPVHHFDAAQLSANLPPLMEGVTLPEMKPPATPARISLNMPATGEEVTLQVETRQAGVLVLADSWYPGWHATVDGQETPVFPVDGLFRGVQVPEGNHDVQFIYTSGSFRIGLLLSAFSIAVMLLGTPFLLWRRLQRRSAG